MLAQHLGKLIDIGSLPTPLLPLHTHPLLERLPSEKMLLVLWDASFNGSKGH